MTTDNCPCKPLLKILVSMKSFQIPNGIDNSYLQYVTISSQKLDVPTKELTWLIL